MPSVPGPAPSSDTLAPERRHPAQPIDPDAVGILAAAIVLIGTGYAIWQQVATNLNAVAMYSSLGCYVAAFVLLALIVETRVPRQILALIGLLLAFTLLAGNVLTYNGRSYGTDSLLFNAYSADLFMRGIDPYTVSMQPSFRAFGVSESLVTPTTDGQAVFALSYPALSFLIYIPALLVGVQNLIWVSVLAHLGVIVTLWKIAPRGLKCVVPLLVFVDVSYSQYTIGAVTDVLWALPAVLAAYYWTRHPLRAAALLGIACAVKQTPWVIVPFFFIDVTRTAWRERNIMAMLAPVAIVLIAFVIPNAPFMMWHPGAWIGGVGAPLTGKLILFGSGIVQLVTSNTLALDAKTLSTWSLTTLAIAYAAYAIAPRRLLSLPMLAPLIAYFLAPRSLQNYFMYLPVVLAGRIVAPPALHEYEATTRPQPSRIIVRARRYAIVGLAALAVLTFTGALVSQVLISRANPHLEIADVNIDPAGSAKYITVSTSGASTVRHVRFGLMRQGVGIDFSMLGSDVYSIGEGPRSYRLQIPNALVAKLSPTQSIAAVALDAFNGKEYYSPAFSLAKVSGLTQLNLLKNGNLRNWLNGSPKANPLAWDFSQADFDLGKIRRIGRTNALRFNLDTPKGAEWGFASISQILSATSGSIFLRLKPEEDYRGDAYPLRIFGVEVVDALQNHDYYTIDSTLTKPVIYRRDRFTVHVFPGQLHQWNIVETKIGNQGDGALAPLTSTVQYNIVAAVHKSVKGGVQGSFGGVFERGKVNQP